MPRNDVETRADLEQIITSFYERMLADPIIGFIFTDIVKIDLPSHLPVIVDFWDDILFGRSGIKKRYDGNALQKHLALNKKIALRTGHFTRWLYLFNATIDSLHAGHNANLMKQRAEMVAKSMSAAITEQKKSDMNLLLKNKL